jgi:hypothetical protein
MKILLLHPDDTVPRIQNPKQWDLIVDLALAPNATYEYWSRLAGCEIFSLHHFAQEIEDLHQVRKLLQLGHGGMLGRWEIDWWNVLCLELVPDLMGSMLLHRFAKSLSGNSEFFCSSPHPQANALAKLLGIRLHVLQTRFQALSQRVLRPVERLSKLDFRQFAQMIEDKVDGQHVIRRRFASHRQSSAEPVILLPSAYVNVSRTAVAYAELLPDHKFLLVVTRSNGKLRSLPPNVTSMSLSPYFCAADKAELLSLQEAWKRLRTKLIASAPEWRLADELGLLRQIYDLLPWGIALRDAWHNFFQSHNVVACLSADNSNPPSSIPLTLAKQRGIPTLACHHGVLDYQAAIKPFHADFYLSKTAMESDYLRRICRLDPGKLVHVAPESTAPVLRSERSHAPWLVFFTEPYSISGWRTEDIYRDLAPRLWSLARHFGLKLVFKLHPFENVSSHRRILRRYLDKEGGSVGVVAGPPLPELWKNTRFAFTVQSSTAVECVMRGIPVFLCAWLRHPFAGYVQQFARFDVGNVLECPEQMAQIPRLLALQHEEFSPDWTCKEHVHSERLASLFTETRSLVAASSG